MRVGNGGGAAAPVDPASLVTSAVAIDPANVTSDDLQYPGGGGLYVSADGTVMVRGSTFTDNAGANGGEGLDGSCIYTGSGFVILKLILSLKPCEIRMRAVVRVQETAALPRVLRSLTPGLFPAQKPSNLPARQAASSSAQTCATQPPPPAPAPPPPPRASSSLVATQSPATPPKTASAAGCS
jgi:hypothetical protein